MKESNSSGKSAVLVGLPGSGKSTFVAALWHVVDSSELDESLVISAQPDDTTYLNEIRDKWYGCQELERNKTDREHLISLNVIDTGSGNAYDFVFPDIAGEMYFHQFKYRMVAKEYSNLLERANGLILFINPETLVEHATILDYGDACNPVSQQEVSESVTTWDHKFCPTQVVIVDILQIILEKISTSVRVSIIISAWDRIRDSADEQICKSTPKNWVATKLPLLYQFISVHFSQEEVRFFGISAQGGEYKRDATKLSSFPLASDRIFVKTEHGGSKDISLPIKWILGNE